MPAGRPQSKVGAYDRRELRTVSYTIRMSATAAVRLAQAVAARRPTTCESLLADIVERVLDDDLVNAVLDDE